MSSLVAVTAIGFTGSAYGMVKTQRKSFEKLLSELSGDVFSHGDCIGSDEQAHKIAIEQKYSVIIHPPDNNRARAFCKDYDFIHPPKPYLVRNKKIVDSTDFLIATPKGFEEELRSGTWSTVRYAKKQHKRVYIIFPDGSVNDSFGENP